ncbi:MAG TPA: glycosyl hydrolase [Patescibacteria group bacterium]|nr:glycosyl hydrolase [Patescibacteria group bacterium]
MNKKSKNFLIELLLVFFILANFLVFSTAYGFYGTNNLSITRIMPAQRNLADQRMKAAGISWAREEFHWGLIEPRNNRWRWANPDQAMATHRRNGIQVVGMLAYSAPWASSNPRAGSDAIFYKPNINEWKNYVSAVVRRYGDVKHWEIWNEPNFFWKPSPNPDEYREILIAAYDTIKSIDPSAKVASGGTTYIDNSFIDSFLNNGGWEHLDAVAVHYYPGVGPESDPINRLRDELLKLEYNTIVPHGGPKEIWITEMGWQSSQIGVQAQAEVIARAMIIARTVNEVPKILIYNLRDDPTGTWGLLNNNLTPKTSYNYYKKTVEFLGNRWPALLLELNDESKFYVFDGPGGPVAAAWNPSGTREIFFQIKSSSIRCYDIETQNGQNVDVTSSVVKSWNNGDIVLQFKPRPIFCQLSNFSAQNTEPMNVSTPQVAGVTTVADNIKEEKLMSQISGRLKGAFSKNVGDGKVLVYRKINSKWQEHSEVAATSGEYNLSVPQGRYYLAYKIPGLLASRTRPFEVKGDSDIRVETNMLNSWLAFGVLAGGVVVFILFVLKYTRRKT